MTANLDTIEQLTFSEGNLMRRLFFLLIFMLTACGGVTADQATNPPNINTLNQSAPALPTRVVATLQPASGTQTARQPVAGEDSPLAPTTSAKQSTEQNNAVVFPTPKVGANKYAALCGSATIANNQVLVDIPKEVQCFFEAFYQARTLERGGSINVALSRQLADGAYLDYTMNLLNQDVEKSKTGALQEIKFSNISTRVLEDRGDDHYIVEVTRTRTDVTKTGNNVTTLTLKFHVVRVWLGGAESGWYIDDFFNPSTNAWISGKATP